MTFKKYRTSNVHGGIVLTKRRHLEANYAVQID